MAKKPKFTIVTACKGRLEHLKQSLPAMLAQHDSEVVVVDFSCPESTADYVEAHYPGARTVRVTGEESFSNWKARNAGAAVAKGTFLVFCDADVVLVNDATEQLAKLITPASFGYFKNEVSQKKSLLATGLSANQLKGFQVIPRATFDEAGGYDDLLAGYAAGGDTELEDRLRILNLEPVALGPALIDRVLPHDDRTRMRFHDRPAAESYLTGYTYRWLKTSLIKLRKGADIDPVTREKLHGLASQGALNFLRHKKSSNVKLRIVDEPLSLLRMVGLKARFRMSLNIEIAIEDNAAPGAKSSPPLAAQGTPR